MSGRVYSERNKELLLNASTGALSGLLYLSYILSFGFLVPVQYSFVARGRKSGYVTALCAAIVIVIGQAVSMLELHAVKPLYLAASIVPPLIFLAAIGFVNTPVGKLPNMAKILIASAVLSLAASPFVLRMTTDKTFSSWLSDTVQSAIGSAGLGGESLSYARTAVESAITVLQSAFSAFILCTVALSWWLGSLWAARRRARDQKIDGSIFASLNPANVHVPSLALWPTLVSWSLLFAVLLTHTGGITAAIVWNISLCLASLYAVQGIGILFHLFKQTNATRILRILVPLAILAAAVSSTAGAVIMIALPVLGITEVWLPYRKLKGA